VPTYINSVLWLVQVTNIALNTKLAALGLAGFAAYHAMYPGARISQLSREALADIAATYDDDPAVSLHLSLHLWSC
jgi:hypothetical protein